MRRILLNDQLRQTVTDFNLNLFKKRDQSTFYMPLDRLRGLRDLVIRFPQVYGLPQQEMTDYLTKIIDNYQYILNADESRMARLIRDFDDILDHEDVAAQTKFWGSVVTAMGYHELRSHEFLEILDKLQIRTCVYCNSQLTLVIRKTFFQRNYPARNITRGDVRSWKGLLQLDHRHAKSHYPFLSTSFFNLYPSCGTCNQAKSDDPCDFILYNDGTELDAFKFGLADQAVVNYWHSRNKEDLVVRITPVNGDLSFGNAYEKVFSVGQIYNMQKDMVEELVHKAEVYTKDYNSALINSFHQLFPDPTMLNRLIIGNYDSPHDIHKRPMSKFIQEIARELKLIK